MLCEAEPHTYSYDLGPASTTRPSRRSAGRRLPRGLWPLVGLAMLAGCGSSAIAEAEPDTAPAAAGEVSDMSGTGADQLNTDQLNRADETDRTESSTDTETPEGSLPTSDGNTDDGNTDGEGDPPADGAPQDDAVDRTAKVSDLPLPDVAQGQMLFAGTYGPADCVETTFPGRRLSTLGVDCQGPTLPHWFSDAGELIVDTSAMTDEMVVRFSQDLEYENGSSPVAIEWSRLTGINPKFIGIANVDELVRLESPYLVIVIDVCRWDVLYGLHAEGATLTIEYGLPKAIRYQLNAMPSLRFNSLNEEGFDAPVALQDYVAQRGGECTSQ